MLPGGRNWRFWRRRTRLFPVLKRDFQFAVRSGKLRTPSTPARGSTHRQVRSIMKIVVIGGTGLIGSKTVPILRKAGHDVLAASPKNGINSISGEGLKAAMAGADVAVDLANSPSFENKAV